MESLQTKIEPVEPRARFGGLWRHRDFMRLWTGQTISVFGSTITREALPLTAILTLGATPAQMGLLGAAGTVPLLLIGLFAGVWVDRMRRRPLMIAADLGRAVLLLSVPITYLLGDLSMIQLYVVAVLAGILTVFFDVAYQAYLPALVERGHLVEGNSKLGVSDSVAEMAGPPLGGLLVQLISGPITILIDAASYLFSVLALAGIRAPEPPPQPAVEREQIGRDLGTGLRAIWCDRLLRPIAVSSAIRHFFGWFFGAIYGLYALRTLGMSPAALGLTVACGGIGSFLAALAVAPATRRLGFGTATIGAHILAALGTSLIWLAGGFPLVAVPLMIASQIVGDLGQTVGRINQISLRQAVTPDG
jgi:MFS family permease